MPNAKKAKYRIEVETGTDEATQETTFTACYLSEMTRGTLEVVLSMIQPKGNEKPQYLSAGEKILRSCWLNKATVNGKEVESDKEILENDGLLVAAAMQAYELVDIKTAKITKL